MFTKTSDLRVFYNIYLMLYLLKAVYYFDKTMTTHFLTDLIIT